MKRETITSERVPSTGKPYSPAVRYGDLLFISGQVAYDPASGGPIAGGFDVQAERVLENLTALLDEGGSSLPDVLKTTCFLANMSDAMAFNEIYLKYFPLQQPARSTIEVSSLSPGYLVEIEAIAAVRHSD